ncbi:hypothetical protein [Methanosarcina sp.]|uniref:hypothetical protein n=1 Tax=Methanosarcina sp. TaxID=2213 RepID=UPI003C74C2C5
MIKSGVVGVIKRRNANLFKKCLTATLFKKCLIANLFKKGLIENPGGVIKRRTVAAQWFQGSGCGFDKVFFFIA